MSTGSIAGESGEVLEEEARARYLAGDYLGSITAHERAFVAYQAEGAALGATRTARIISWLYVNVFSDFAVAGGWLARAERLLGDSEGAERGWVELTHATREPYGEGREQRLREACEIGRFCGDADLEFAALARLGETLALTGKVEAGMLAFDEALTAVCADEVKDLYVVESVFCALFLTCERVHDVVRAEQWLRAAGELVRRRGLVCVGPLCRAHYGGILTAAALWKEAGEKLDEALRVFAGSYAAARVIVLVRLAELRVGQGRLEDAAILLEGLDQLPDAARPLAALQLARGGGARAGCPATPAGRARSAGTVADRHRDSRPTRVDHLIGSDSGLEDPVAFVITVSLSVALWVLVFGRVAPRAKADSPEKAAKSGFLCTLLAVFPGVPTLFVGLPFILSAGAIAMGLLGRGSRHGRLATAAIVIGSAVLMLSLWYLGSGAGVEG